MRKKIFLPFPEHFECLLYYFTEGNLYPLCLLANNPTEKKFYYLTSCYPKLNPSIHDGKEYIYVYKG